MRKPLLEFSDFCKKINTLKREIHTGPIKAILRYMLTHKGITANTKWIQTLSNYNLKKHYLNDK